MVPAQQDGQSGPTSDQYRDRERNGSNALGEDVKCACVPLRSQTIRLDNQTTTHLESNKLIAVTEIYNTITNCSRSLPCSRSLVAVMCSVTCIFRAVAFENCLRSALAAEKRPQRSDVLCDALGVFASVRGSAAAGRMRGVAPVDTADQGDVRNRA